MAKLGSTVIYGSLNVSHDIRSNANIYVNYDKPVWHTGNMGTGSGLDADKVDGLHFRVNATILEISTNGTTWTPVSMTAADILTQLKTVDGTGTGLDADTLDGLHAAAFLPHSLFTAANDFVVASGVGVGVKKTLAETKTILGINAATDAATGVIELATAAEVTTGTDTTRAVTPAGLKVELDKKANLAAPTFTGVAAAVTAAVGTNTTQIATTAFVNAEIANDAVLLAGSDMTGTIRGVYSAMGANDIAVSTADVFSKTISGATTLTVSRAEVTISSSSATW
jgi:hypothetical protein